MKKFIPIILILILASLLRLIVLDKYPAGLNADEAAIGYNDWSLLETGMDEHKAVWPSVFRSFDDYKPAVYFYLALPFIKVLGLNIWAVRLPSAILGIASVYLIFLISRLLIPKNKYFAPLSALLLAVSPWHLQFSRGGWEANAATFFILLGVYSFFASFKKQKFIYLFVLSLALSLYTYHSARVVSPLLALSLVIQYKKTLISSFYGPKLKIFISAIILGIVISIPLASQLLSKEGQSRFSGVSIFSDTGPLWQALEQRRGHPESTLYVKSIHNQYLSYSLRFVKNYLSHYSTHFLFITGDEIARSRVPRMGQSYILLIPFYFIGLLSMIKFDTKEKRFIFFWFLTAPLAASLTFQAPHALRAQNMSVPLCLIMALGLAEVISYLASQKHKIILPIFTMTVSLLGIYSVVFYLHSYYIHYPKELSYAWQYGFDQVAGYSQANYDKYDKIIVSDQYDQPYILMAFFLKYPPQILQNELVMTPRDKFGFSTVRQFGKFEFRRVNYDQDKLLPNTLIIAADESVDEKAIIHTIKDLGGKTLFKFVSSTTSSASTINK